MITKTTAKSDYLTTDQASRACCILCKIHVFEMLGDVKVVLEQLTYCTGKVRWRRQSSVECEGMICTCAMYAHLESNLEEGSFTSFTCTTQKRPSSTACWSERFHLSLSVKQIRPSLTTFLEGSSMCCTFRREQTLVVPSERARAGCAFSVSDVPNHIPDLSNQGYRKSHQD